MGGTNMVRKDMLRLLGTVTVLAAFATFMGGCDTLCGVFPTLPGCEVVDPNVADSDGDGVLDAVDACPDTAAGAVVDATGCVVVPSSLSVDAGDDVDPAYGGDDIALLATVADASGAVSFSWLVTANGDAGSVTLANAATQTPTAAFSSDAEGTFTFEVTATDASTATDTDSVDVVVTPTGVVSGTTFTIDNDTLVGTASDDEFDGTMWYNTNSNDWLMTVGNSDSADGVSGADVATIELDEGVTINPTLANIATVDIVGTNKIDGGAAAATFNASKTTGMTTLGIDNSVAAMTVSNLDVVPNLALTDMGADVTLTFDADAVEGTSDALAIAVSGATAGTLTLPETIESMSIASSGATANVVTDIVDATSADDATGLGDITVTGDQDLSLAAAAALDASVDTIDAGALAGDLTVVFGNADSDAIVFTGGSGDDTVTMGTADDTVTADLGDGDDTITVGGFTDGTDAIDGGDGTDTLAATSAVLVGVAASLDDLDGIEQLEVSNALNGTINLSYFGTITQVTTTTAIGGNSALTGVTSGLTVVVEASDAGANTFGVTVSGTGTSDAVTLNLENGGTAFGGLTTLTGLEVVTIDSATGANTLTGVTVSPSAGVTAAAVTVTGDQNLTLGTVTAATPINAAALTGNLSLTLGQAGSVTGGAGDDTLAGSAAVDLVSGGAGDDALDGNAGNDVVSGGAGADTIDAGAGSDTVDLGDDADIDTLDFSQVAGLDTVANFDASDEDILDIEADTVDGGEVEIGAAGAQAAAVNDRTYVIELTLGGAAVLTTGGTETIADFTDVADVAAYLGERFTNSGVGAFCVVLNDGTDSYVYIVTDAGADADLTGEVVHIGTITGAILESADVTQT